MSWHVYFLASIIFIFGCVMGHFHGVNSIADHECTHMGRYYKDHIYTGSGECLVFDGVKWGEVL